MRCPKCQYIGFDSGDRCRNCGYEFSLVVEDPSIEVTIGRDEPGPGRINDLSLTAFNTRLTPPEPLDVLAEDTEQDPPGPGHRGGAGDLPLFTDRIADDQAPLVTPPAVPRPPLSVRRAGPPRQRPRMPPPEPSLDLGPGLEERDNRLIGDAVDTFPGTDAAGIMRRLIAGIIDLSVLGTIAALVLYLTLRVVELPVADWNMLPLVPLAAFLLLLFGGYFTLFTAAGGQTIGKMVAKIRVIAASVDREQRESVSFGTAVVRAAACFCSVVAVGAGFLPVLFSADRRAFHDRVAETRVVSA